MSITAKQFVDIETITSATNLYNDIRTSLEEAGWEQVGANSTYWWKHKNHSGSFSMSAAFRQVVIDREEAKSSRQPVEYGKEYDGTDYG